MVNVPQYEMVKKRFEENENTPIIYMESLVSWRLSSSVSVTGYTVDQSQYYGDTMGEPKTFKINGVELNITDIRSPHQTGMASCYYSEPSTERKSASRGKTISAGERLPASFASSYSPGTYKIKLAPYQWTVTSIPTISATIEVPKPSAYPWKQKSQSSTVVTLDDSFKIGDWTSRDYGILLPIISSIKKIA